jgi:hypothetical protein
MLRLAVLWQRADGALHGTMGDVGILVRAVPSERRRGHSSPTHEIYLGERRPMRKSLRVALDAFGIPTREPGEIDG